MHCLLCVNVFKECRNVLKSATQPLYCHHCNHKLRNYWVDKTAICYVHTNMCAVKGSIREQTLCTT